MVEIELEKTYLAKNLPSDLKDFSSKEIVDMYIPASIDHPVLRIRKRGDRFEITKKEPVKEGDASMHTEHTIKLTELEFNSFEKIPCKKVSKIRYDYRFKNSDDVEVKAEIDVFKDELEGLVLVDVEFPDEKTKDSFCMPDFCLVEVTQDHTLAGGMLCGKKYSDIESHLYDLGYSRLA